MDQGWKANMTTWAAVLVMGPLVPAIGVFVWYVLLAENAATGATFMEKIYVCGIALVALFVMIPVFRKVYHSVDTPVETPGTLATAFEPYVVLTGLAITCTCIFIALI